MSKKNKDTAKDTVLEDNNTTVDTDTATEQAENETTDNQQDTQESDDPTAKLNAENQELQDKYRRLFAEFDNYKKRTVRERIELMNTAAKDTLTALLPVLDDFDRAQNLSDEQKNTAAFQEGIQLVYNKLHSILKQRGLEAMESTGEVFDADLHEALTEIPAPTEDLKGKIVDTIEKGYTLNGKIIRHAKVVTGK